MGALHDGHLSLVRIAASKAEVVVASIFVNPKQFGPDEDLERYPRDLDGDAKKLQSAGCHLLFCPEVSQVYPPGFQTRVEVDGVTEGLCGAHRAGHFNGVTTVVLKLLNIVRPDVAVFGEKDFQQLSVIRTMAKDLDLDAEIVGAPLVREPDGLARSSRNAYLSAEERQRALRISAGLMLAQSLYQAGERAAQALLKAVSDSLAQASIEAEYLELRRYSDLAPLSSADEPCVILVAAQVGKTRLIDNLILRRPA